MCVFFVYQCKKKTLLAEIKTFFLFRKKNNKTKKSGYFSFSKLKTNHIFVCNLSVMMIMMISHHHHHHHIVVSKFFVVSVFVVVVAVDVVENI